MCERIRSRMHAELVDPPAAACEDLLLGGQAEIGDDLVAERALGPSTATTLQRILTDADSLTDFLDVNSVSRSPGVIRRDSLTIEPG